MSVGNESDESHPPTLNVRFTCAKTSINWLSVDSVAAQYLNEQAQLIAKPPYVVWAVPLILIPEKSAVALRKLLRADLFIGVIASISLLNIRGVLKTSLSFYGQACYSM